MADQTRKKARSKQPFTRHPLFPAVLALWCGAILALAGLVFAPDVALTSRILLALGLGVIGGLLGVALARKINAPAIPAADAETGGSEMAVGDGALWQDLKASRRALTDETPAVPDHIDDTPPVIERDPQILDVAEFEIDGWNDMPAETEAKPLAPIDPAADTAAARIAHAELDDLSPVELLERLALSMERRRLSLAVTRPDEPAAPALTAVESSPAADCAVMPGGFAPQGGENEELEADEEELEPEGLELEADEEVQGAGYSSLLDLGRTYRPRPWKPEEPSTAEPDDQTTDGSAAAKSADAVSEARGNTAAPSPKDSEDALRAALAALQKMSGAA